MEAEANIFTARIRRMGEGNVLKHVCLSVRRGVPTFQLIGGGGYLSWLASVRTLSPARVGR